MYNFSQLSFVQNNNYSERVCCQCASKVRILYDCFSFVKSFLEKEESNDLDKTVEINESWKTTTIAYFKNKILHKILCFTKIGEQTQEQIRNKTVHRFYKNSSTLKRRGTFIFNGDEGQSKSCNRVSKHRK